MKKYLENQLGSQKMVCWPNGKASDYESGDCRFDPCVDHYHFFFFFADPDRWGRHHFGSPGASKGKERAPLEHRWTSKADQVERPTLQ